MTRKVHPVSAEQARKLCESGDLSPADYVRFRNTPQGRRAKREPKPDGPDDLKEAQRNSAGC